MEQTEGVLHELRVRQKECREAGVLAGEWVRRYAQSYLRKYGNIESPKTALVKEDR